MKPWRVRGLTLGASLAVVVALATLLARSKEATYKGRNAAGWFGAFRAAKAGHVVSGGVVQIWNVAAGTNVLILSSGSVTFSPGGVVAFSPDGRVVAWSTTNVIPTRVDEKALSEDAASVGLRALGTNAALYLAREYGRGDAAWALAYRRLLTNVPPSLRKLIPSPPSLRQEVRRDISDALAVLGMDATAAIPGIVRFLLGADRLSFQDGIQTLGKVPGRLLCSPNAVEPSLQEFCRRGEYTNAVDIIEVLQLRTPATAELLSQGLSASDTRTREACAVSLERFGIQALAALPAVTLALGDADGEVRYYAARTLEKLGTHAVPAREALERATNDSSVMVRRVAGRELQSLDDP
jgi:hypothetical protein